jgi:hypothetical protein
LWANNMWKVAACGVQLLIELLWKPVSAICPPLHSTHGRKLTTITHLFNQTSLNPVPYAQVCVFDSTYYKITTINYISKTSLYTTFPIYHIPHVFIRTLAAENLDVCTACDLWDSNIQLTMLKDWRRQIYPKCHLNMKLTIILISKSWGCPPPGAGHAFPRQRHIHGGGGVIFPVWCHPWMDDGMDEWMEKASLKMTTTFFTICNIQIYV